MLYKKNNCFKVKRITGEMQINIMEFLKIIKARNPLYYELMVSGTTWN